MIQNPIQYNLFVSDFILVVGGWTGSRGGTPGGFATVEAVSADPDSNPVPNCMQNITDFPKTIYGAVGTTFGKLREKMIL